MRPAHPVRPGSAQPVPAGCQRWPRLWFALVVLWYALAPRCLTGCSTEHIWHGDVSFTLEEREAIESGNIWLAEHTGTEPKDIVWDLPPGDLAPKYTIRNGHVPAPFNATREDHSIRIDASMMRDPGPYRLTSLACVSAHELGHELGFEHHAGPGIMNPYAGWVLTWTAEDAAECRRAGVC